MTSRCLVDRQKEGGGRSMMKGRVQEKKEEPSSLKGHWPLSSFPPPCTARPLTRRLEAQPYLGRAACSRETAASRSWAGQQEFFKYQRHIPPYSSEW